MSISSRIKAYRESKGFSQEYMANSLNISQDSYSRMESGEIKVDLDRMKKIARALNIELFYLLG